MFFWAFYELQPSAFPFFCCLQPVFGAFWPSESLFLTFSPHSCLRHFVRGKKSKSGLLQAKKDSKTGFRQQKKGNASGISSKKCPKKHNSPPKPYFCPFLFFVEQTSEIYTISKFSDLSWLLRPSVEITLASTQVIDDQNMALYLDHRSKGTSARCEVQSPTGGMKGKQFMVCCKQETGSW